MYICLSPYILTIKINYYYYNIFVSLTNRERMRKNINIVSIYYYWEREEQKQTTPIPMHVQMCQKDKTTLSFFRPNLSLKSYSFLVLEFLLLVLLLPSGVMCPLFPLLIDPSLAFSFYIFLFPLCFQEVYKLQGLH
jgi:hypothetical protein